MTPKNMYADNICVNITSENLSYLIKDLKNELEDISNWMRVEKLRLNARKSEFIVVGRRRLNGVGNGLLSLFLEMNLSKGWRK